MVKKKAVKKIKKQEKKKVSKKLMIGFGIIILAIIGISSLVRASGESKFKAKHFESKFTITYNSMTLEEIAKKEAIIKDLFKDACDVEVKINEVNSNIVGIGGSYIWETAEGTVNTLEGHTVENGI